MFAAAAHAGTPMGEETVGECAFDGCYVFAGLFFGERVRLNGDRFAEDALLWWGGARLPFGDFGFCCVHCR